MDVRQAVGIVGRWCIYAGVLILAFVAYQLWGTGLVEARTQDRLRSDFLDALELDEAAPAAPVESTPSTTPRPVPTGDAVAILRIPKIGVEKAVVEGVGVEALKAGPGHYPTTPLPGQPGNAAIAGHRTTYGAPFYRTDELEAGDVIEVTTRQGDFTYRVREKKIVQPTQNEVLAPSTENLLTLTTCNPRFSAAQRLIIVGELVEPPAAPPAAPADDPPAATEPELASEDGLPSNLDESSLSGDDAPKTPAILWGLGAAAIWLITGQLARRWGRLTAYAMGGPVFVLVLFVFFENFARLLPANY